MPTTIKLKTGSGAPTAGALVTGEPALDLTNARLYTENSVGSVIEVGVNPTTVTTSTIDGTTLTVTGITLNGNLTATGTLSGSNYNDTNWNAAFNDKINSAAFNTADGVLTLNQQDGGTVTVDLDGRYEIAGAGSIDYITGGTFNTGTGELALTGVGAAGATIDLDGRYVENFLVRANAAATDTITSGETLTFANGTNTTVSYDSATNTFSFSSTDTNDNTTYTLTAAQTGGNNTNPNIFLNASTGTDSNVQLVGGGATTVTRTTDGSITISSTDTNTNTTYTAGSGLNLTGTTFSHADTSSQASVNNSGQTFIQDVTLDSFGHVTGLASAVATDTNTTYAAGTGLALSGTTFSLDFSELTDKTSDITGTTEFIIQDATTESRKAASEIKLSNFNNNLGWTSNVGDITNVSVTSPITGGGSSGSVSIGLAGTGLAAGTYGSTANGTKIDTITTDAYGRITAIATGATGTLSAEADTLATVTGRGASTSTECTFNGVVNFRSAVDLADNDILRFGSSDDCEFFFNGTNMYIDLNLGDLIIRDGTTTRFTLDDTGDFTATGNITAYSDERLKDDIETLDGSKVYEMRGVSFTKDGKDGSGVIAQELQKVAPELVHEGEEYLSVAYGNLVGYLIEAVKDLKAEIEELKGAK